MNQLPKKYAVGQNISRLARVRPESAAISMGLDQDATQEGLKSAMDSGPIGRPGLLKRISIKKNAPKAIKFHPLKIKH